MVSPSQGANGAEAASPTDEPSHDRLQALAMLLPAALLAWPGPGALLAGVPTAASSGAGLTLLASIPAAALLLARRVARRTPGLLLLLVPVCIAALRAGTVSDTFGADRALCVLVAGVVQLLCAASLGERGRRTLVAGFVALGALWLLRAGLDPAGEFTGTLENTGDLSEAALPGALCGLALYARSGSAAGLTAGLAFALYVALVPVHAGTVALVAALAALTATGARRVDGSRRTALVVGLVLVTAMGVRHGIGQGDSSASLPPASTLAPRADSSLGGFAFREYTWARVPALVLAHPWAGVGPGQFEAGFPPYRDPREIELSSFGRQAPYETQVEHAHNDWLEGLAEYGLPGGLAWIAFLLCVGRAAWRRLADPDGARAACALAALGLLVDAFFNSPLLEGPVAHALAFAVFGVVLGGGRARASRSTSGLVLALGALALPLWLAPGALRLFRHGLALSSLSDEAVVAVDGIEVHAARKKLDAVERALGARPDSAVAASERAFLLRALGEDEASQLAAWETVLRHQPYRFEALLAIGNLHARAGRVDEAAARYERAREVDPEHPGLRRNALTLALARGRPDEVARALSELGDADLDFLRRAGASELLRGRPHLGLVLLGRVDDAYVVSTGEEAFALSQRLTEEGLYLLANAMEAWAHLAWGREHMRADDPDVAVRSYRQSLRIARGHRESLGDPACIRLELAAALVAAGRKAEALAELEGVDVTPTRLAELPPWVADRLSSAGLIRE